MGEAPTIEGFIVQAVKDETLPKEVRGLPISREVLQAIMSKVPIVVSDPSAALNSSDSSVNDLGLEYGQYNLLQPSENHQRSFVVDHPDFQQTWQDEFGNQFSAISIKGNNFSRPGFFESATASEGVIPFGLQESSIIERVLKASQLLRSKGVSTEYIFGVTEPKEFPWLGGVGQGKKPEVLSLDEYKRRIVIDYWSKFHPEKKTIDTLGDLHRQFEKMTFFVTFRATDSPYRLSDMLSKKVYRAVFEYANKKIIDTDDTPYDPDNPEELVRYENEIAIPRLGKNMARLHFAGLAHKFPHRGNITALGGIVDLDSVYGEPLGFGEDKINFNDIVYDLTYIISESCIDNRLSHPWNKANVVEIMNTFMNSYADEIKQLAQTTEEARQHMAAVLYATDHYRYSNEPSKYVNKMIESVIRVAVLRFCDEYLDVDLSDRLPTPETIADKAGEYYEDERNYISAKDRVFRVLSELKNEIMREALWGASFAYGRGVEFSAVDELIKHGNDYAEQQKQMITEILDPYRKETATKYKAEHQIPAGLGEAEAALFELAEERIRMKYDHLLRDYAKKLLNEKILPQLRNDVDQIFKIAYPDNILSSHESSELLEIDTVRNSYIIASEIELDNLLEELGDADVEQGIMGDDKLETILEASEGYRINQIIMDTSFSMWHVNNDNDQMSIGGSFDIHPTYILVVESNEEGDRKLRLLKNTG